MKTNLDNLTVAAPCSANWNEMSGDERARFCGLCKKHVYNISAMSRTEAEALLKEKEGGRVCLRLFKRADGTVIVDNCPVGLRAIRKRLLWIGAGVAAAITFIGGVALAGTSLNAKPRQTSLVQWFFPPKPAVAPVKTVPKSYETLMGDVCIRPSSAPIGGNTYVPSQTGKTNP
jgi:hypothetical protein